MGQGVNPTLTLTSITLDIFQPVTTQVEGAGRAVPVLYLPRSARAEEGRCDGS